jgi:hypothetical protein
VINQTSNVTDSTGNSANGTSNIFNTTTNQTTVEIELAPDENIFQVSESSKGNLLLDCKN